MADLIHSTTSSKQNMPPAGIVFRSFTQEFLFFSNPHTRLEVVQPGLYTQWCLVLLMLGRNTNAFYSRINESQTGQTLTTSLNYICGGEEMTPYIGRSQTRVNPYQLNKTKLINTCHMDTFLVCQYLTLSSDNMSAFIAEIKDTCGLNLGMIFEAIKCGELESAKREWVQLTHLHYIYQSNAGSTLDLAGNNWERTAGVLEFARFLHHKDATLCNCSTPFINLDSTLLRRTNGCIILQEMMINYCHKSSCTKRTGSCSTNGAHLALFISLEKIASQMNIASIPIVLFSFGHRYQLLFVSLGVLPPQGIGHITGLMNLSPGCVHYDGAKEYPFERVTSAAQLKYTGIYLAVYIRDGLSSNQWSNDSQTLLEKIQESKIDTNWNLHFQ